MWLADGVLTNRARMWDNLGWFTLDSGFVIRAMNNPHYDATKITGTGF